MGADSFIGSFVFTLHTIIVLKVLLSSSRSHSRSHSRSGQGQGQGQDMVRTWSGHGQVRSNSNSNSNSKVGPELYTKIGFHPPTHPLTTTTTPSLNECFSELCDTL